jgi:hypothetical protein
MDSEHMPDAFGERAISFGDTVRILPTKLTEELGLAGLVGSVFGQTIPSSSGVVDVIGEPGEDYAVNVFFGDRKEGFWFAENLLEFVDHGAGAEIRLDGIDRKWTRTASGEWIEEGLPSEQRRVSLWARLISLFKRA